MSFEKFQERFLKSINNLGKANRPMNSAGIIDEIWYKVQHPGLNEYITTLQVQKNPNPLTHDCILQCIAIKIPKIANFNNSNRRIFLKLRVGIANILGKDKRQEKEYTQRIKQVTSVITALLNGIVHRFAPSMKTSTRREIIEVGMEEEVDISLAQPRRPPGR